MDLCYDGGHQDATAYSSKAITKLLAKEVHIQSRQPLLLAPSRHGSRVYGTGGTFAVTWE